MGDETWVTDIGGFPPSRQKEVAKMGHGDLVSLYFFTVVANPQEDETWVTDIGGFPPSRQKEVAKMGHGDLVSLYFFTVVANAQEDDTWVTEIGGFPPSRSTTPATKTCRWGPRKVAKMGHGDLVSL